MDFDFNQEQYMFRETVQDFLARSRGQKSLRDSLDGDGLDSKLWAGIAELGVFSILVPEEYGGLGLGFIDLALVLEEFGRALVPTPVIDTIVATDIIAGYGTDEQKAQLLPRIAEGQLIIVPAIAEADAGFDPDETAARALPAGNGWTLEGRKILVPDAARADRILVTARFGPDGPLGLAIIPPDRNSISLREHTTLDPTSRLHEVLLQGVAVDREDVLGGAASPNAVRRLIDASRVVAATQMTGIAGKVLDESVAYAKERVQFGKPIGAFQAIKHKCADMAVATDSSRSAAYYAAWALTHDAPDLERAASLAKAFCGETSRLVCNEGIQIHGGMGFTWELGLHFYLRRAKMLEYSHGDAGYHRERVLAATIAELTAGG